MPDPVAVRSQRQLMRLEETTARQVARAYERARREITQGILEKFVKLGPSPTPDEIRELARDAGLLQTIDDHLSGLSEEYRLILRANLTESQQIGLQAAQREIERLISRLDLVDIRPFVGIDPQLPGLIETVIRPAQDITARHKTALVSELMTALIRGDSFPTITARLLAADPGPDGASLFARGKVEAQLFARRTVIEANNASRQLVYEQAEGDVPGLQKQVVAAIQSSTTETCLRAHGQIRDIKEPYRLTAKPRFAREIMYPPFHWNCRSASVAYHPDFEQNTRMTTEAMREAAKTELEKR